MAELSIEDAINAFERHVYEAYIEANFPPVLVKAGYYKRETAANWLKVTKFVDWASQYVQTDQTRKRPRSPSPSRASPSTSRNVQADSNSAPSVNSRAPSSTAAPLAGSSQEQSPNNEVICLSSDEEITKASLYCTRETRAAFRCMWKELWDVTEAVTGKAVQFKFMDGTGLKAIVVDGCKEQVDGCGDALIERAAKLGHATFAQMPPRDVVQYIIRTCQVHLDRKFDDMAKSLPPAIMERIRGFLYLEAEEEVKDFVQWCDASPHKIVKNWMADKKPYPWFIPSVNQFMSKIPKDDWYNTPSNTNLNESAHPYTNIQTGTSPSLLQAIKSAKSADMKMLERVKEAIRSCILPQAHNTQVQRDRNNRNRRKKRGMAGASRSAAQNELEDLNDQIQALKAQKKALQDETGIRRSPSKTSSRGKTRRDYELASSSNIYDTNQEDQDDIYELSDYSPPASALGDSEFVRAISGQGQPLFPDVPQTPSKDKLPAPNPDLMSPNSFLLSAPVTLALEALGVDTSVELTPSKLVAKHVLL